MPTPTVPLQQLEPSIIAAGTTAYFLSSHGSFLNDAWNLAFVLNDSANLALSTAGTAYGTTGGFSVTITAEKTGILIPGSYEWTQIFTNKASPTDKAIGKRGYCNVLPDVTAAPVPSFAQQQVALLRSALAALSASSNSTVSANGQSWTRANIKDYTAQLVMWEARVISDREALRRLRGEPTGGAIGIEFQRQGPAWPGTVLTTQ